MGSASQRGEIVAVALLAAWLGGAGAAAAAVSCPGCLAVAVLPDTQAYTRTSGQPRRADHLKRVTEYLCAQRAAWREPGTGKQMPIAIALQVGDLVEEGRLARAPAASRPPADPAVAQAQWLRASAAFDVLDACGLPYVVVPGNHDHDATNTDAFYQQTTDGYDRFFGAPCMPGVASVLCAPGYDPGGDIFTAPYAPRRGWEQHRCADPPHCAPGTWYLGNGDDIAARSRNRLLGERPGPPGPRPGRHRSALVHSPSGRPFLFIGLDHGFDFGLPPPHGDDLRFVEGLLDRMPDVPTVLVQHWMWASPFTPGFPAWPGLDVDALEHATPPGSSQPVWDVLVRDHPQVFLTLNGHWRGTSVDRVHTDPAEVGASGRRVVSLFRNVADFPPDRDGMGWITMLVFDPGASQIRARWHRIDTGRPDHRGTPRIVDHDLDSGSLQLCPKSASGAPRNPRDPDCEQILPHDFGSEPAG